MIRVPLFPSHDSSAFRRVLNYVSFAAAAVAIGTWLVHKPDVVYVYHPPLTAGLAGAVLSRVRGAPFVYDVQDLWPDTLSATGMVPGRRALRLVGRLCSWVYQRAASVVVLSPGFKEALIDRGVPREKVQVIFNWCDERSLVLERDHEVRARLGAEARFNVVFAGTLGRAQGLEASSAPPSCSPYPIPAFSSFSLAVGSKSRHCSGWRRRSDWTT